MNINKTKADLAEGHSVFGTISPTPDPLLAEWVGLSGLDYHMLDGEHGLFNPGDAVNFVRACELRDITPMVRIGSQDPKLLLQYVDAGFQGVMVPGLMSAAAVAEMVQAIKYPPVGTRGLGPIRAAGFQLTAEPAEAYISRANSETMFIAQFEHPELLDELPAILAVPGLDAVMIGPRDLSLVMGFPDGPDHEEVQAVINQAITQVRSAGRVVGITAGTRDESARQIERGARMILTSTHSLLNRGVVELRP
jgi:4-hydroxy-2-oxoheptanedioate aldolase